VSKDRRTNGLDEQREDISPFSYFVDLTQFCQVHFVVTGLGQEEVGIGVLDGVRINVRSMQSFVLVVLLASEALVVRLEFSLHDSTDCDYVSTDAHIYQVIFQFTVNSLGQFPCIDTLHIVLYLLDPDSLVEGSLG
jgi:hypothetical protein